MDRLSATRPAARRSRTKPGAAVRRRRAPGGGERDLADRLHSAAIHLLRRLRREDRASGVGPARLSALSVLVFASPVKLGDLARAEQVSLPTASRIVDGLEGLRLARRRLDARDRRVTWIEATPRGRRLLERARGRRLAALRALLADLEGAERAALERAAGILERLLREPPGRGGLTAAPGPRI